MKVVFGPSCGVHKKVTSLFSGKIIIFIERHTSKKDTHVRVTIAEGFHQGPKAI